MPRQLRIFYAHPYQPASLRETIDAAARRLKGNPVIRQKNVEVRPWTENPISGRSLITTVLRQIDRHNIFACDLTYPNANVNFELGYAIAKFKRIIASLNTSIEGADREYRQLYFPLLNMGYTAYDNHESLADSIMTEKPWDSLSHTLLDNRYRQQLARFEDPTLMYMKPPLNTDSVLAIQEEFGRSLFQHSLIVDDPNEYSSQILQWYVEKLLSADAVVVHLLGSDHANQGPYNLKSSIIAGLAMGFGRPLLMLAHEPYESPLDYEKWLNVHDTAEACVQFTKSWLNEVTPTLMHRRSNRQRATTSTSTALDLRNLFLGEPVAEHEADRLYEYFVETSSYYDAARGPLTILLGRRGTGKTAILYALRSDKLKAGQNHVTVLKPIGYETHGLIRVLEEVRQKSERGFLIESLWKYLIYSEIAVSAADSIRERSVYNERSREETAFLNYVDSKSDSLNLPFSVRLDSAVASLEGVGNINDATGQRIRISEGLHDAAINDVRRHLGEVLADYQSLTLLTDGLDEPWGPGEHIPILAELIAGLLSVLQSILNDFRRSSSRVKPVDTNVTVLLRSDIFAFVQHLIPEQDKLPVVRVNWNDQAQLRRVLEERMLLGAPHTRSISDVWSGLFPEQVVGVTPEEFILRTALPRPRDIIHLVRSAVSSAINRGHQRVQAEDLLSAREQYSGYAFDSILKEDDPTKGKLESVLYQFAGPNKIVDRKEIETIFASAGVDEYDANFYLDLLCDISFLGIESRDAFRYSINEEDRRSLRSVASVVASREQRHERFEINPAFYQVLQID